MTRLIIIMFLANLTFRGMSQFAPPAGQVGTTALYKDSTAFREWASSCIVTRGYQDISNPSLGLASAGDSSLGLDKAGVNGTVSLGDGGSAILQFKNPIADGEGSDFAVFENSFSDTFLELAFIEVSSDGIHYFRFPATSNTQDTLQVGTFGSLDATKLNNLAGKYRGFYGTPFDLAELSSIPGLDIANVTHVKIIDVVGSIQENYASYDKDNRKVNDPWKTPFASSGFDLDAVGVIHESMTSASLTAFEENVHIFPNPAEENLVVDIGNSGLSLLIEIRNSQGAIIYETTTPEPRHHIWVGDFPTGIYFIKINTGEHIITKRVSVN